jgi:outer membrane protein OmpA-like peptidoglycan-associated protein
MRRRVALALGLLVAATGCAKYPHLGPLARNDLYVLLPGADGKVGALVVTSEGQEQTLRTANGAVKIGRPGAIETATATPSEIQAAFGSALGAQPPRPTSFFLYFPLDSDELTPESQRLVGTIMSDIAQRPAPEVIVIGHTDTMGTEEYNDRLSLQRAEGIRTRLIARGIPEHSIQANGRGERELLVPTADQVAEPKNRRVEICVR